jgi:hypothetical protein
MESIKEVTGKHAELAQQTTLNSIHAQPNVSAEMDADVHGAL